MINFPITSKTNKKAGLPEQAAGFPPFTRGYSVLGKSVEIGGFKDADFTLTEYTDQCIINLFTQIISHQAKEKISLNLPFTGKVDEIIYLKTLRTLLAFVSEKLHNNAALVKFEFYGICSNQVPSLNTLILANASQLSILTVNNTSEWEDIKQLTEIIPVDSLYGSSYIEHETEIVFFRLWKKIEAILR